jgi:hypothetical protein
MRPGIICVLAGHFRQEVGMSRDDQTQFNCVLARDAGRVAAYVTRHVGWQEAQEVVAPGPPPRRDCGRNLQPVGGRAVSCRAMTTEIKSWEIVDGRLVPVDKRLADYGRREALDLESWLESDPSIIRPGLKIIGRQVLTRSGPLDLLAIDRTGSVVVIELKRDRLPREALAQAIDYAADIATWSLDKLGEVCASYCGETLEDVLSNAFPDIDLEGLTINGAQRIALVGFALEPALERMIEWLSEAYGVAINAVVLKYIRSANGAEILTRSAVISEEEEEARPRGKEVQDPNVRRARYVPRGSATWAPRRVSLPEPRHDWMDQGSTSP